MPSTLSPVVAPASSNGTAIAAILARQAELEQQNQSLREARDIVAGALARHELLYEQAPVGYATIDNAATVVSANRALSEMLRTPKPQLLGRSWLAVVDHEDRTQMLRLLDDALAEGAPDPIEVHLRSEEVGLLTVAVAATRDVAANRCRLVVTDHTRQRDADRLSADAEDLAAIGRLTGRIAHSLNNLLTVIGCHNEFVLRGLHPSSDLIEHAAAIRDAVTRSAECTEQLLSDARLHPASLRSAERASLTMT